MFLKSLLLFISGITGGCLFMLFCKEILKSNTKIIPTADSTKTTLLTTSTATPVTPTIKLADPIPFKTRTGPFIINDLNRVYNRSKDDVAIALARQVRVLCWVMTQPKNHQTFAKAVKETWGRRCHILLFISSVADANFPIIGVDVTEGKDNVWKKTRAAWKYIYERHYSDADWFIKADDDSLVILENLRLYLDQYKTTDNHVFGYHVDKKKELSVGAGYVFSKKTLEEFYKLLSQPEKCRDVSTKSSEDKELFKCLQSVGIQPTMSLDSKSNALFHDNKFFRHQRQIVEGHHVCCSKNIISLHKLSDHEVGIYNYFLYKVRTYGHVKDDL